jgi:hypothetical protein
MQEWFFGYNRDNEITFIPVDRVASLTWLDEDEDSESGMLFEFRDNSESSLFLRRFGITRSFDSTFQKMKNEHSEVLKTLR